MRRLEICGVILMEIKERISQTKQKLEKLKGQRNILTKVQVFKFQPFSPPAEADPYLVGTGQSGKGL